MFFQLKDYSVFPGQVIHSAVTNPTGSKLVAHNLSCDATPKLAAFTTKLMQNDTIQVVMASGPFTTNDSLAYEPFRVSNLFWKMHPTTYIPRWVHTLSKNDYQQLYCN